MKHSLLETAIGAIVLFSAFIFLVFSYSTAHRGEGSMMDGTYRLSALFDNIAGLKVGDPVIISGVKVGTINDIALDNKLYRAKVYFSVGQNIKLSVDTAARISSESLLGGKYLELQPGGDDADLKTGDIIAQTQSATNLEDLLGRFIFSASDSKKEKDSSKSDSSIVPSMPPETQADHP